MEEVAAQNKSESQQILEDQSHLSLEKPMQDPLQSFTSQTLQQIRNRKLTLDAMSLLDLEQYQTGLRLYKPQLASHIQGVNEQIERKAANRRKEPTTAEKAANWWAAMGIIFLCLSAIVTWGAYSVSQIQQIENLWLKWVLTTVVLGVGLFMLVFVCKWIWPRRDINQFEKLFETSKK